MQRNTDDFSTRVVRRDPHPETTIENVPEGMIGTTITEDTPKITAVITILTATTAERKSTMDAITETEIIETGVETEQEKDPEIETEIVIVIAKGSGRERGKKVELNVISEKISPTAQFLLKVS